jgi:hypothetical protein
MRSMDAGVRSGPTGARWMYGLDVFAMWQPYVQPLLEPAAVMRA